MPTYVYVEQLEDGRESEPFEVVQPMSAPAWTVHPSSGRPVRRLLQAPNLCVRYSEGATKGRLENKRVERAGFTKYERDRSSGMYHKVAGKDGRAPATLHPSQLRK